MAGKAGTTKKGIAMIPFLFEVTICLLMSAIS